MSLNQIIDQNVLLPLVCDSTLKLKADQIRIKNRLDVPEGSFENVDTFTINGNVYPPGGGFIPTPVSNKILRTTGLTVEWGSVTPGNLVGGIPGDVLKTISPGVVAWDPVKPSDLTPGLANQLLHTNSLGTAAEWVSNVTIPQNLDVLGSTVLQSNVNCDQTLSVDGLFTAVSDSIFSGNAEVGGDLTFVGNSGSTGQFVKKTGLLTQDWSNIVAADVTAGSNGTVLTSVSGVTQWVSPSVSSSCIYSTTFDAQNINSVGPTAILFSTSPYANQVTGSAISITQPSGTQFTIGTTNLYNIMINGFIDPTSTGLGNSIISLSLEVNGVELQTSCVVCNGNYSFTGSFSSVSISATQIVRVLARRIVGTGTLNTFASGSAIPSFASTISFWF